MNSATKTSDLEDIMGWWDDPLAGTEPEFFTRLSRKRVIESQSQTVDLQGEREKCHLITQAILERNYSALHTSHIATHRGGFAFTNFYDWQARAGSQVESLLTEILISSPLSGFLTNTTLEAWIWKTFHDPQIELSLPRLVRFLKQMRQDVTETTREKSHTITDQEMASTSVGDSVNVEKLAELPAPKIYYRNPDRNPEMVEAYLARYPEINNFIREAWPALLNAFGEPVEIVLEVLTYPEEGYQEMVGWIQSQDDVYKGLEKFERFQDEWFLDHMNEVSGRFNFNLETK